MAATKAIGPRFGNASRSAIDAGPIHILGASPIAQIRMALTKSAAPTLWRVARVKASMTNDDSVRKQLVSGSPLITGGLYIGLGDRFDDDRRLVRATVLPGR